MGCSLPMAPAGNGGLDAAAGRGFAIHLAFAELHGRGHAERQARRPRWADGEIGLETGVHAAGHDGHGDRDLARGLQHVSFARRRVVDDGDGGVELERPRAADGRQRKFRTRAAIAVAPQADGVLAHDAVAIRQRGDGLAGAERRIRRAGDEPHIVRRRLRGWRWPTRARPGSPESRLPRPAPASRQARPAARAPY